LAWLHQAIRQQDREAKKAKQSSEAIEKEESQMNIEIKYTNEGEFIKAEANYDGKIFFAHGRNIARAHAFLLQEIAKNILQVFPAF
jgi:hypothetical protein